MLNCVYHPTQEMRVVEDAEKEDLLATGVWFDHPTKAKEMREVYEKQINGSNAQQQQLVCEERTSKPSKARGKKPKNAG